MAEEGDDLSGAADFASESSTPEPPKEESKKEASEAKTSPTSPALIAASEAPKSTSPSGTADSAATGEKKKELNKGERIFASPIAKKIALEQGIPLAKVKGTGPDGRITREDVEKYKPGSTAASAPASQATSTPAGPEYTDIPVSNMRKIIGQRLSQSKQELPHYYVTVDIDMGRVSKLREVFNKSLAEKEGGAKLSVNDFITKAAALAMKDVPDVNCAWLGDTIRQ